MNEMTVVALALLVLAAGLAAVGLAGRSGRLPRSRWIGLRTAAVRRDGRTWRIGHRAASGPLLMAAGPPLLLAVALLVTPPAALEDWFLVYALVGVVTGGLIALASRQAQTALDPDRHDEPPHQPWEPT